MLNKFTATSLQTFLNCRRKAKFSYIDLLAPKLPPWALTIGKLFHKGLELYSRGEREEEILLQIKEEFKELELQNELDEEEYRRFAIARATVLGALIGYIVYRKKDEVEEVEPEFKFSVDFNGVVLAGKIDGKVRKEGRIWIKEYKTTSSADIDKYLLSLDMNFQVDFYLLAMQLQGAEAEGVMYEVIRKPLIKQRVGEKLEDYLRRIKKDYIKRPEHYFFRTFVYRGKEELEEFKREVELIIDDFRDAQLNDRFYRNPHFCSQYRECIFKKICLFGNEEVRKDLQRLYRKKEVPYEELQ